MASTFVNYLRRMAGEFSERTSNHRAEPDDLLRLRPAVSYVVAPCDRARSAESVARRLLESGYDRNELVLVSNRVHTLRPFPEEEPLEVVGSLRAARRSGWVGGLWTGACFGALLGVLWAGLTARTPESYAWGALIGGVAGVVLGAAAGRAWAAKLRRRPDAHYDQALRDDQVLIGVGLRATDPAEPAIRILTEAGLTPRVLRGEDEPDPSIPTPIPGTPHLQPTSEA